ncbi:MAG: flagellar basal body-associated FliL family protein [Candidatus Rokubacteria bacterium]|nr:flagellar basal body-associated FliL family protein [Candidatus Rokubacteria bacterium]
MAAKPAPPMPPPEATVVPPSPRRGLMVLTWCAVGVALLATVSVVWLLVLNGPRAEAVQPKAPVHVYRAGTIVVNIAESSGRRYLRTTLELGTPSAKEGHRLEEMRAQILDAAIGVLGATPADSLLDHAKRDELKEELKKAINERVGPKTVSQVFFTEFVIQ